MTYSVRTYVGIVVTAFALSLLWTFVVFKNPNVTARLAQLKKDAKTPLVWAHAASIALLYTTIRTTNAPPRIRHATDTALIALLVAFLGHLDAWYSTFFVVWAAVMLGVDA